MCPDATPMGPPDGGLPKAVADRVGRAFNLLFNRVAMYQVEHPSTQETVRLLTSSLQEGLKFISPLTVVLDRERIYVEEEPLDPRVNTQRLVAHMKKAGVQSVSFEKGITEGDIAYFARVFSNPKLFPSSEAMKQGLAAHGIQRVKINHVFFKKVTADEDIVSRNDLLRSTGGLGLAQVIIDQTGPPSVLSPAETFTEGTVHREDQEDEVLRQYLAALTISGLLKDPSEVSRTLLGVPTKGLPSQETQMLQEQSLIEGIKHLKAQLKELPDELMGTQKMESLVGAVYRLREEVKQELQDRRERGEFLGHEQAVRQELDDLTDQVMIQLVKEEYRKGEISVKRLAQILRRMMPEVKELKRLLPKLKEALLAEGMPLSDYLSLIKELEKELQSEELELIIEEGAKEIGLSPEDLIKEMRRDPREVAELIALATEIRSLGTKAKPHVLTDILVEYVESVSEEVALEKATQEGPEGGTRLGEIISEIQSVILEKLKARLGSSSLLEQVQKGVGERTAHRMERLKKEWAIRFLLGGTPEGQIEPKTVLEALAHVSAEPEDRGNITNLLLEALREKGVDVSSLQALLSQQTRAADDQVEVQKIPKGCYHRSGILLWLREEIKRSRRYPYTFSVLLLGIRRAIALRPVPLGFIRPSEVRNILMESLAGELRETDLVGYLEETRVLVVLPFTGKAGVQVVRKRLLERLEGKVIQVRGVPMRVNVALVDETVHGESPVHLSSLLRRLDGKLAAAEKAQ